MLNLKSVGIFRERKCDSEVKLKPEKNESKNWKNIISPAPSPPSEKAGKWKQRSRFFLLSVYQGFGVSFKKIIIFLSFFTTFDVSGGFKG